MLHHVKNFHRIANGENFLQLILKERMATTNASENLYRARTRDKFINSTVITLLYNINIYIYIGDIMDVKGRTLFTGIDTLERLVEDKNKLVFLGTISVNLSHDGDITPKFERESPLNIYTISLGVPESVMNAEKLFDNGEYRFAIQSQNTLHAAQKFIDKIEKVNECQYYLINIQNPKPEQLNGELFKYMNI